MSNRVLSNGAIAERLVICERTVKSHVTTILGKLHLADRTQAAIFAWREASPGRNAPRVRLRASGSSAAT